MWTTVQPNRWTGPYSEWRSDAPHDPGLCADVRSDWMADGERIILRACEIIGWPRACLYDDHTPPAEPEGRGKDYRHISFQWDAGGTPSQLCADCVVPDRGRFGLTLCAEADWIDLQLSIRNDTNRVQGPIDWAFCAIALESPGLRDPEHARTFIFDGQRLRSLQEINGRAMTAVTRITGAGGFVSHLHASLPRSPVESKQSVIILQSRDGRHVAALGFEQSYNSLSCTGNMCFHADPYFGMLDPGIEKRMRGALYLMEGSPDDALDRYRRDFAH